MQEHSHAQNTAKEITHLHSTWNCKKEWLPLDATNWKTLDSAICFVSCLGQYRTVLWIKRGVRVKDTFWDPSAQLKQSHLSLSVYCFWCKEKKKDWCNPFLFLFLSCQNVAWNFSVVFQFDLLVLYQCTHFYVFTMKTGVSKHIYCARVLRKLWHF